MRAFRDTSIKRKLVGIIMLTTIVALLLACSVFLPYEVIAYHRIVTRQLGILAHLISQSSTAALAFDDRPVGQRNPGHAAGRAVPRFRLHLHQRRTALRGLPAR